MIGQVSLVNTGTALHCTLLGYLHVLGEVEAPDVGAGDDPIPGQLPDVKFVHS